jgi:hypothetical protein
MRGGTLPPQLPNRRSSVPKPDTLLKITSGGKIHLVFMMMIQLAIFSATVKYPSGNPVLVFS